MNIKIFLYKNKFNNFNKFIKKLYFLSLLLILPIYSCNYVNDNFNYGYNKYKTYKNSETIYLSLNKYPQNLNPFIKGNIFENTIKNLIFDSIIYIDPLKLRLYSNYLENIIFYDNENKIILKFIENSFDISNFIELNNFLIKNINNSEGIKFDYLNKIKLNKIDENTLEISFIKQLEEFEKNQIIIKLLSTPIIPSFLLNEFKDKQDSFYKIFNPEYLKNKILSGPYFIENVSAKSINLKLNNQYKNPLFANIIKNKYIEPTNINFTIYESFEDELNNFLVGNLDIIYFNDEKLISIFKKYPASIGILKILNPYNNLFLINNISNKNINFFSLLKLYFIKEYKLNDNYFYKIWIPYSINGNKISSFNYNYESTKNSDYTYTIITINNKNDDLINFLEKKLNREKINYQINVEDTISFIAKVYGNLKWDCAFISIMNNLWNLPDLDFFNPYSYGHITNLSNTKKITEINLFANLIDLWDIRNYFTVKKGKIYPDNKKINKILKEYLKNIKESESIFPIFYKPVFIAYNKKIKNINPVIYNDLIDFSFPKMIFIRKSK